MRATGFSGMASVMGVERKIVFDDGDFTIEGLSLDEAQLLTELIERSSSSMGQVVAAARGAGRPGRAPTTQGTQTGRVPTRAEDSAPDPSLEEERAAVQAIEREEEQRLTKEEAARQEKEEAARKKKAAAEKAAAEKAEKDKRGNTPEPASGTIDVKPESSKPAGTSNGKPVPEEVRKAKHLRAVIAYCSEALKITDANAIVQWCHEHSSEIEIVSRIGDRLQERVERAIEITTN